MQTLPENQGLVKTGPKIPKGGRPLTERVAEALIHEDHAFCFEFFAQGGEEVYSCYHADNLEEQAYALEAVGGMITHCNCPDAQCRKRVCKHAVQLAVLLGYGILPASLPKVSPAISLHAPSRVMDGAGLSADLVITAGIQMAQAAQMVNSLAVPAAPILPPDWLNDWK